MKKPIETIVFQAGDSCADLGERAGTAVKKISKATIIRIVGFIFLIVFGIASLIYGFARGLSKK
jgi:hypothetical protein